MFLARFSTRPRRWRCALETPGHKNTPAFHQGMDSWFVKIKKVWRWKIATCPIKKLTIRELFSKKIFTDRLVISMTSGCWPNREMDFGHSKLILCLGRSEGDYHWKPHSGIACRFLLRASPNCWQLWVLVFGRWSHLCTWQAFKSFVWEIIDMQYNRKMLALKLTSEKLLRWYSRWKIYDHLKRQISVDY